MTAPTNDLFVAAIDFGNTFSGYAFASRNDVENDPSKIHTPLWIASSGSLISSKTSTTILLNINAQVVAFGFDAESKYTELLKNGEDENYFYFCHFKMMLYKHAKAKVYE